MSRRSERRSRAHSLSTHVLMAFLTASLANPIRVLAAPPSLVPQLALQAAGPRVAIVVIAFDAKARAHTGVLENAAEGALRSAGRYLVVPSYEAFNPSASRQLFDKVEAAKKKVREGRQHLDDLDHVKAIEAFADALTLLKDANSPSTFKDYVDTLVLRAAAHATGGENAAAKKDIDQVLALHVKAEFTPTYFPPELIKYAEAQRKQAASAHADLTLSTTPTGARVWVDGAFQGTSPVTVAGLTAGKHVVAAATPGSQLTQAEFAPGAEELALEPAELSTEWKKAKGLVLSDPDGPQRDEAAQMLAKAMGVDQVLLVEAKKSTAGEQLEVVSVRVDAADRHNWAFRSTTVNPGRPDALRELFDSLALQDSPRDGRSPVTHYKEGSSERTVLSVGLIGLGVAAVATGVVFGVMAGDRAAAFRDTKQTDVVKSEQLRTQGQSFAVVADISYLVGIASAATGTVLLITNKGNGGDGASDTTPRPTSRRRDEEKRQSKPTEEASPTRSDDDDAARGDDKKNARKQREEEDRKRREEERQAKEDASRAEDKKNARKQREEEDHKRREEERQAKEDAARQAAEDKKRADEERKASRRSTGSSSAASEAKEEERRRKEQEDAERRKREEEDRRRIEEEKKKAEQQKKKEDDHDDLRNF